MPVCRGSRPSSPTSTTAPTTETDVSNIRGVWLSIVVYNKDASGPSPPMSRSRSRLPDRAALIGRTDEGRAGLAGERGGELGGVGQRADHAELGDRVRIALDHQALGLGADRVGAELAPGDEELLIGGEAVERGGRRLALRLL